MLCYILILFLFYQESLGIFNPTNETDLSRCKIHYSRSGTTYSDYYQLPKTRKSTGLLLDFHFSVLAPSDAHILLAPSETIEKTDPAYEIVIGAGGNTFCDIRRMQKSQVKESIRIKGLLSALDIRSFWIHMTADGVLEVGKEGDNISFISWKDLDPLPLNVISFSTWPGIEAKWFFDCIIDGTKRIARKLTDEERLRKDLFTNYDPYSRPVKNFTDITIISFDLVVENLLFDEHKSVLNTVGSATIKWHDEKLIWNEANYGGIDKLTIIVQQIWKPNIILYNSVDRDLSLFGEMYAVVYSSGKVIWGPKLELNSWCDSADYSIWPKDIRKCDLLFTFWTDFQNIQFEYPKTGNLEWASPVSQWEIDEVVISLNYDDNNSTDSEENESSNMTGPPMLNVCLGLRREFKVYSLIYFSPYAVVAVLILSIFCVSPFGYAKIAIGCFQMVLSSIFLFFLGISLPAYGNSVPYIIQLHSWSIIAGVVANIISLIVINVSRIERERALPTMLIKILTCNFVKMVFCLPEMKKDEYGKLSAMSRAKSSHDYCILLGIVMDRICLAIGIVLVSYSMYSY